MGTARPRRLEPTRKHALERRYRRPGGPWDVPTLDTLLTDARPRRDLVVDGVARLGSAQVNEEVARLAGGLQARGVRRGDAVAWQTPNWFASIALYRACWRLGAVAVPLHHRAGDADIEQMLAQVEPVVSVAAADLPLAVREGVVAIRSAAPGEEFSELMRDEPVVDSRARPQDLACVLFTSGSTGGPKGVMHTHRGLAYKALLMQEVHSLTANDAVLMPAPLAHVSGLLNGLLNPGVAPMKSVLMDRWDPENAVELIEREEITFMVGPPTFFVNMMESPGFAPERVSSLRLISSGGAGVTEAFVTRATEAFGAVVKRTYGSTEAPTVTTSHHGDDPVRARQTDGRVTGEAELRVVDPATGTSRPSGEAGELWLRGPELFAGYVDREATRRSLGDGDWFRTADLAVLDDEGWLTIVGRTKDVIIRAGENISASEVESILESHPAVRAAVVVGETDARLGERVVAFVVASEPFDLEACRAWFGERGVARFKTPERVVQLDRLPLLPSGKPDRGALREGLDQP